MREFMRRVPIKAGKRGKDDEKDLVRDILRKQSNGLCIRKGKKYG